MSQLTLSRELALRIGLAAKALPDTQPKFIIQALAATVGLPLNTSKLASLTLEQYRHALTRSYAAASLKKSLALLQTTASPVMQERPQPFHPDDMPHSIRVAIASEDGIHIDGQFSLCRQFYIFQLSAMEQRLIAIRPTETSASLKAEKRQTYLAEIIQDCQVLYSLSIGGPAAAKVIKQGVHPIKLNEVAMISDTIEQLQHVLSTSPPPWLAKSMGIVRNSEYHSLKEELT